MDQHICLFYLADKLTVPKLQEFYHRMCSALGYGERKYESYYLLYDSQYHIFKDTPLTDSRKKALTKIASCSTCHTICKKNIYKPYQIEDNACIVCKLSSLYRNGRIRSEANVLRRFLAPNAPFSDIFLNPSMAFNSCVRLGRDYAIGTFPIIQMHAFLYAYLKDNGGYGDVTKEAFLDGFVLYLFSKVTTAPNESSHHMDATEFHNLVQFHLEQLYLIDSRSISADLWDKEANDLKRIYTYIAPSPAYNGISVAVDASPNNIHKQTKEIGEQYSLFDMVCPPTNIQNRNKRESDMYDASTYPNNNIANESIVYNDLNDEGTTECAESSKLKNEPLDTTEPSEQFDAPAIFDPCDMQEIPEDAIYNESDAKELYNYYPDEEIPEEAFSSYDGFVPQELLYDDTAENDRNSKGQSMSVEGNDLQDAKQTSEENFDPTKGTSLLLPSKIPSALDSCVSISELLFDGAVQSLDSDHCFDFSEHVLRSEFVCIEPAVNFNRYGLLIFVPDDMHTYFFDMDLYGTDMLESLFMEDSLDIYTMHTLTVIDLFARHFSSFQKVCPLDLILSFEYGLYEHSTIFERLGWSDTNYYHYMPSYPMVYASCKSLSEDVKKNVRRLVLLYRELAKNDQLGFLNKYLSENLVVQDIRTIGFRYRFGMEIHQKGFLYILSLPEQSFSRTLSADGLLADVLLILNVLPHSHQKKVYLLSVEPVQLVFFYLGDKDEAVQFYDLFLARLQNSYLKRNKRPLQSNSYCYMFDRL